MARCRTIRLQSAVLLIWIAGALSAFSQTRQIVVLYDERIELPGLAMLDAGFTRALTSGSPERVEIYREEMDLSRFDSEGYRDLLRDQLRAKYAAKKIDVVVAVMEPALRFLLNHRSDVFPGTPIVFCGLDRKQLSDLSLPPAVTGVLLKREFSPTLELATHLHPETERIVVVAGTSEFDTKLLAQARAEFQPFENRFAFTYLTALSLPELLSRLSQLPPKTIVLYTTMFRDGGGHPCVPHDMAERISAAASVPVYGFLDQYLGHGIVGGRLYGLGRHGEEAAGLVFKILSGRKPEELSPIEPSNSVTQFDARQLRRWKINEDRLPAGSTVLFREPTVWERYRKWIIGGVSVFLLQALLITGLLANLVKRRRAERSLTESEKRFQSMADAAPVLIWMSGEDKLPTYFNKAWLKFTGRSIEQELGNGWKEGVQPDDLAKISQTYGPAVDAREPFVMQYRLKNSDGEYRWITDQGVPRYGPSGNFRGYVGACADITDLLKKEATLRQFEERVALAAEAAQHGVWELDTATNKLWVSDKVRTLLELDVDAPTHEDFQARVHPDDRAARDAAIRKAIATKGDYELEYRVPLRDGAIRWIGERARCLADEKGELTRLLGVSVDITKRKQAEEETHRHREQINLLSRVSLLGEMTTSLAHELYQPLSAIITNANAGVRSIDKGKEDPGTLREILVDVQADGRRAHDIIRNVRNTIRKTHPTVRRINLNEVVTKVAHIVRPDAVAYSCEVETSLATDLPLIEGDPVQIQQVLVNLVSNALDAMRHTPPDRRKVEISTAGNGDNEVRLSVRDHGTGIRTEVHERLFDRFFTTKEQGLGMGLAIVRSIVESHGGDIQAENVADGGARFYFTLPVKKKT